MTISKRITNAETVIAGRTKRENPTTGGMAAFYQRLTHEAVEALFTPHASTAAAVRHFRKELLP